MKLGLAWYGFRGQSSSNYFESASALGLRYVEIPIYSQSIEDESRFFNYRTTEGINNLKSKSDQANVTIVSGVANCPISYSAANYDGTLDKSIVEFGKAYARRAIDISQQLGLEVLRICEPSINQDQIHEAGQRMEKCGIEMKILGDYALERGIALVVENYGLTSEQMLWCMEATDHPNVGTLYDPCNYYRIGEDPLSALKNVRDYVKYVHLKDASANDIRDPNSLYKGSRWPPSKAVGEGEIDWLPIIKELASFYKGYLGFEYEMKEDNIRGTRASVEHITNTAEKCGVTLSK